MAYLIDFTYKFLLLTGAGVNGHFTAEKPINVVIATNYLPILRSLSPRFEAARGVGFTRSNN